MKPPINLLLFARYGWAPVAIAGATAVQVILEVLVPGTNPYPIFLLAIMVAVWQGGLGPGLLTAAASTVVVELFLLGSPYTLVIPDPAHTLQLVLFLTVGMLVSVLLGRLRVIQQRALNRRTAEFDALMETLPAFIWVAHDPACLRVTGNAAASRLLHVSTGHNIAPAGGPEPEALRVLLDGQEVDFSDLPLQRATRTGQAVLGAELQILLPSGEAHVLYGNAIPLFDEQGAVRGGLAAFLDISERKRAEQELRESEERFRTLANAAPIMIWMAGPDQDLTYLNQPWLDFTGRTFQQERGRGWLEGIHPEDRPLCVKAFDHAFASRQSFDIEYRLRRHDGEYRHVLDRGVPRLSTTGALFGYVGTCLDVTDWKEAERSLAESGARFRELADAMPQIVWTATPDGRVDYANERWHEVFGKPAPLPFLEIWKPHLHPRDVPICTQEWAAAVARKRPFQVECRFRHKATAGHRWFLGRAVPVCDPAGRVAHWYGTCTDIDDQKRSEEALREADRRKDLFLAMLSHELRNPLAPIRNSLHLLSLSGLADPAAVEACHVIDRQVKQLMTIVDDMLDVFRVTYGKTVLHRKPLDLVELVRQCIEDYRATLEAAQLRLGMQLAPGPVWVEGDRSRLLQVLGNLLQNAGKFSRPGDRITVRLTTDPALQRCTVTVQDTGMGIAPEMLDRVFDMFSQAQQPLETHHSGLGIGLTLVKSLVEMHGGEVAVASRGKGQGSEFSFWLPLVQSPRAAGAQSAQASAPRRHLRVLIVEDNPDAAHSLQTLLERYGHDVKVAATGPEGLQTARNLVPDVILCDIGLPELDGYAVAHALRSDPATQGIHLIAVTGYGREEDRQRSQQAGFDLHLTKPVDPPELLQHLTQLVKSTGPAGTPPDAGSVPPTALS